MFATRRLFLRHVFTVLLAFLVLLGQTLALTHRHLHPNNGVREAPTIATIATTTALDPLFGHTNGTACDAFDAAFGNDINPGQRLPDMAATEYVAVTLVAVAQSNLFSHPFGLFLARAPPRA